ncbi:MAG: hypothetical protein ABII01_05365 [Candidatus Woesearchaeota archaeon]
MTRQRIAVLDVLGPAYHYDEKGWVESAVEGLKSQLISHGYSGQTQEAEARDEEDMIKSGKQPLVIMPGFVETVLFARGKGIKPVIVSAGTDYVLERCIELAAEDYDLRKGQYVDPEDLVRREDRISTVPIGSKRDIRTWRKAVERYDSPHTIAVYEDSFPNLVAALNGLDPIIGCHVTSTRNGLAVVEDNNFERFDGSVYRGHMLEHLPHLQDLI